MSNSSILQKLFGARNGGAPRPGAGVSYPDVPEVPASGTPPEPVEKTAEALLQPVSLAERPPEAQVTVSLTDIMLPTVPSPEPGAGPSPGAGDAFSDLFEHHDDEDDKARSILLSSLPAVTMQDVLQASETVKALLVQWQRDLVATDKH
ncbi:MAG: hypothetical protein HYX96_02510 [Chloroflexi bacterium]|nr:hypothetical protein [Chloroflexota bacterium]